MARPYRTFSWSLVVALLAIVLGAAACKKSADSGASGSGGATAKPVVAVVPKGLVHVFWRTVNAGAARAAKEENVEMLWAGPNQETDYIGQINIVEDFINRKVSAIVLAPGHQKALVKTAERAQKEGIPVVVIDSELDYDKAVSFVATDNYQGGALAARRMGKILDGKGKVAIVGIAAGTGSGVARETGFQDTIKKEFPGIEVVGLQYSESDRSRALTVAEDFLTRFPDLAGIFGSAEPCAVGALRAIENRGLKGKVKIVGFDASPQAIEALRAGTVDSLVVQDPFRIGYDGVKSAVASMHGKPVQKRIDTGAVVVTRENIDSADVQKVVNPPGVTP
jgi:ribose transport system substrate-binding protein